jgi:hypothetical protein
MNKSKPAPALPSVADARALVAKHNDELISIRAEIASRETGLIALALDDDDSKFEESTLAIERLRRSELRADKRLIAVEVQLAEAQAREKEARRAALYLAGEKAVSEIETLASKYTEHAGAIVEILREINRRAEVIEIANNNRADYAPWFEAPQLALSVRLPIGGGEYGWLWPEAQNAEQETVTPTPFVHLAQPLLSETFGERFAKDGTRVFKMPPSDWGMPREFINTKSQSPAFEAN